MLCVKFSIQIEIGYCNDDHLTSKLSFYKNKEVHDLKNFINKTKQIRQQCTIAMLLYIVVSRADSFRKMKIDKGTTSEKN